MLFLKSSDDIGLMTGSEANRRLYPIIPCSAIPRMNFGMAAGVLECDVMLLDQQRYEVKIECEL